MATISEIKAGLDDIAQTIRTERQAMKSSKARISSGQGNLNLLPTVFADIIADINGFTPTGAFEELAKDELAKLTAEYLALVSDAGDAVTVLNDITEF